MCMRVDLNRRFNNNSAIININQWNITIINKKIFKFWNKYISKFFTVIQNERILLQL